MLRKTFHRFTGKKSVLIWGSQVVEQSAPAHGCEALKSLMEITMPFVKKEIDMLRHWISTTTFLYEDLHSPPSSRRGLLKVLKPRLLVWKIIMQIIITVTMEVAVHGRPVNAN